MAATFGTYFAFGVFFKPVLTEFGWTRALTSGAFSLSMIMHGVMGIVMGILNDRLGPRIVLSLCGFLIGLGYLLMPLISTVGQLYLFYGVIVGTGLGGVWVPLLSTVARWFVNRRSTMTGIVVAGSGIGTLISPPVANWLISTYDWRAAYTILGSVILVVVISAAQFLKRDPARMGQIPYGGNEEVKQEPGMETRGFTLREAACTRQFWVAFTMLFCFGFCLFTITVHIVPHATDMNISPASAAIILAAMGGAGIAGNLVMGGAADRIGNRQIFIIGFIMMSICLFCLTQITEVWMLYLFVIAFGFAHGGMGPSESPLVAGLFGLSSHGLIFGIVSFGFTIGASVGPLLTGYLFDVSGSYQTAFLTCACLTIVGLVLAILLSPLKVRRVN